MNNRLGLQIRNHKEETIISKSIDKHMAMYLQANFQNGQCKSFMVFPWQLKIIKHTHGCKSYYTDDINADSPKINLPSSSST